MTQLKTRATRWCCHTVKVQWGTIISWVQSGNSWRTSTRTEMSKEAKWCPKHECRKWRNSILRRDEQTLHGQNVSWWSIQTWKTNRYPFECSVRAFQRCRRCVKRGYGLVAAGERKNRGFSSKKEFSLQNHSFACVAVVIVERREGPKSCGDSSGQTNCWNCNLSVAGKRPNLKLCFWWIEVTD